MSLQVTVRDACASTHMHISEESFLLLFSSSLLEVESLPGPGAGIFFPRLNRSPSSLPVPTALSTRAPDNSHTGVCSYND